MTTAAAGLRRLVAAALARWSRARPGRGERDAGRWGEQVAAKWLARHGYEILGRRVRPNRRDEIDLVARRERQWVFVEVKTRRSEAFGRPAAAVDARKRRALCRAAASYLRRAGYPAGCYRFDVVEVVGAPDADEPIVRHIEDAFRFETRYRFPATERTT